MLPGFTNGLFVCFVRKSNTLPEVRKYFTVHMIFTVHMVCTVHMVFTVYNISEVRLLSDVFMSQILLNILSARLEIAIDATTFRSAHGLRCPISLRSPKLKSSLKVRKHLSPHGREDLPPNSRTNVTAPQQSSRVHSPKEKTHVGGHGSS